MATRHHYIFAAVDLSGNSREKLCQKWDSNPRPHTWTRILHLWKESNSWVWRLRPLGHPDMQTKRYSQQVYLLQYISQLYLVISGGQRQHFRKSGSIQDNSSKDAAVKYHLRVKLFLLQAIDAKTCRDPGLNQGPSDLQSDALPTELSRLISFTNTYQRVSKSFTPTLNYSIFTSDSLQLT